MRERERERTRRFLGGTPLLIGEEDLLKVLGKECKCPLYIFLTLHFSLHPCAYRDDLVDYSWSLLKFILIHDDIYTHRSFMCKYTSLPLKYLNFKCIHIFISLEIGRNRIYCVVLWYL